MKNKLIVVGLALLLTGCAMGIGKRETPNQKNYGAWVEVERAWSK